MRLTIVLNNFNFIISIVVDLVFFLFLTFKAIHSWAATPAYRSIVVGCVVTITSLVSALLTRLIVIFVWVVFLGRILNLLIGGTTQVYTNIVALVVERCLLHWVNRAEIPIYLIFLRVEELLLRGVLRLFLWVEVLLLDSAIIRTYMSDLVRLLVLRSLLVVLLRVLGRERHLLGFYVSGLSFLPGHALLWCFISRYRGGLFIIWWLLLHLLGFLNKSWYLFVENSFTCLQSLTFWFNELYHLFLDDVHLKNVGYRGSIIWFFF